MRGSDSLTHKHATLQAFSTGQVRVLVTKPSIAGFGLNWQHCRRMVFVGLNYSFEELYQALRRCWRFGQTQAVDAHLIMAETEGAMAAALRHKQAEHATMQAKMVAAMQATMLGQADPLHAAIGPAIVRSAEGDGWTMHQGDCVEVTRELAPESVHFALFSPPFSTLYTYSPSLRDMGNCEDDRHFFEHFGYLLPELERVLMPGRLVAVHCKNLPMYKSRYGVSGLRDFRGDIIRAFVGAEVAQLLQAQRILRRMGLDTAAVDAALAQAAEREGRWAYHSEVCIWKDPVREMQRTKTQGLLYKQVRQDASYSRQGLPEYLLLFRRWVGEGTNPVPITHTADTFPLETWQRYASPVWFDIRQTDVLNEEVAKEAADEKHICPLQLDVCRRAIELWTNPGEVVFSPFTGIGSEGYEALKLRRRFVGIELKGSYWDWACRNLERAIVARSQLDMFSTLAATLATVDEEMA